jgi:pimeloyl-ACP methyl ester carboxylesterase
MPKEVMSVHGIQTFAPWQKTAADVLSHNGFAISTFHYGFLGFVQFLLPTTRRRLVESFRRWYVERTHRLRRGERPSVIAHSLGAYLVGRAMMKYPDVRFDKVLFFGSILPRDFEWQVLIERNQFWMARNDYGMKDGWATLASLAGRDMGASGSKGFLFTSPVLEQKAFSEFTHGDYYKEINIEKQWIPFLRQPSLEFDILYGRDVPDLASFHRIFESTHQLDINAYTGDAGASEDELIPDEVSDAWIAVNPAIYVFLTDRVGGRILGYANIMPVTEDAFKRILSGELEDNQIVGQDILPYQTPGPIHLYFMSIVIHPDARRISDGIYQRAFERLLYAVVNQYAGFMQEYNTVITDIAAVGWTWQGQKLCDYFALQKMGADGKGRPIYRLTLDDSMATKTNTFKGFRDLMLPSK